MKRFDEIADKLKITAENARQRFGRCMKKLKSLINQQQ
jgi:DNA-directed RNA polymerase sigma subunit (sigma70/sigma32)